MEASELLTSGLSEYKLTYSDKTVENFFKFSNLLVEWNKVMNLTGITEDCDIVVKHYLDSVAPLTLPYFKENMRVIDVGCGAGFPGFPIKIVREDLEVTLLDSLNKRINFLKECVKELKLDRVICVAGRAEEYAQKAEYREKFDIALSRAVANLQVLIELCCGYIKVGGYFIALKGPAAYDEVEGARGAIEKMGCELVDVIEAKVPNSDLAHTMVIIKKVKETPKEYPRNFGRITKKAL